MAWFRNAVLSIAAVTAVALAGSAQAAEARKFDAAAFAAAQAANRPVLIEVAAWWCPVCASQERTIKAATAGPAYEKLLLLRLDYDKQKAEWQKLGATKQATLIGYRGTREVGRVIFQTDKQKIGELLATTVR